MDKLFKTALCLMLFVSFFACAPFASAPTPSDIEVEKEEQAVFSVFVKESKNSALILQNTSTSTVEEDPKVLLDRIKGGLPGISNVTIENFLQRNAQPSQVSPNMQLGVEYSLLTETELMEIASQQNWHVILQERYPGVDGYYIFSRVGFNNSLDQAVVYVGKVGGPLMGSGSYYLLAKQNGIWTIIEDTGVWES